MSRHKSDVSITPVRFIPNRHRYAQGRLARRAKRAVYVNAVHRLLGALVLLGTGLAAALAAHGAFFALETGGIFGRGYHEYAHTSLPFAAAACVAVLCYALASYVAHVLDRRERAALVTLARSFANVNVAATIAAVATSALVALAVMEGCEHSLAQAFGAEPVVGMIFVAAIGACFAAALRASARWIAGATEYVAAVISAGRFSGVGSSLRTYVRRSFAAPRALRDSALRFGGPQRAPPPAAV